MSYGIFLKFLLFYINNNCIINKHNLKKNRFLAQRKIDFDVATSNQQQQQQTDRTYLAWGDVGLSKHFEDLRTSEEMMFLCNNSYKNNNNNKHKKIASKTKVFKLLRSFFASSLGQKVEQKKHSEKKKCKILQSSFSRKYF